MIPTRIETHIVEPHRNPALQTAARGLVIAVARCGRWPVSATLDDYQDAVDRAQLEVCRIGLVEERYCWQFRRPIDDSEPVLVRLMMQRDAALALCQQRAECVRLLTGPAAGLA